VVQYIKPEPLLVGSAGFVTLSPYSTSCEDSPAKTHPFALNVTVSVLLSSHFAYKVISAVIGVEKLNSEVNSGSVNQPTSLYQVFVGSAG
jgi:hypothetical protein